MGFLSSLVQTMRIKVVFLLVFTSLIILKVAHGYSGCSGSLVPCMNKTHCISIESVCVDYHDCQNDNGAKTCHHCAPNLLGSIACVTHVEPDLTFECLSDHQICDGNKDCINNEDEESCGRTTCRFDHWLCKGGGCIEKDRICDDHRDCPDGSDEGEICYKRICGANRIRCRTGACIDESKKCDGIRHCSDGFDEENCLNTTTSPLASRVDSCATSAQKFTCSTSAVPTHPICLTADRVCDGHKDCPEGDDEHDCADVCSSKTTCPASSNISCIEHRVVGQLCRCKKPGYRIVANSSTCQDFNECSDSLGTYCSLDCINTDGDFNCTCPPDYTLDAQTKTCRRNDMSKSKLLILFDNSIQLYSIATDRNEYTTKLLSESSIDKYHRFDYIQYDLRQKFVVYYDQVLRAVLCKSDTSSNSIVLLFNLTVHGFAYNPNDRSLFIVENQSKTLRMYKPIICDVSINIKMHAWPLTNVSDSIQALAIDVYNRQLIFASKHQFFRSNLSKPNSTETVHTADREIKAFIYDASFKRIFWTAANVTGDELFPVFTCNRAFEQCHDTSIRLPSPRSFGFLNDGLLYTPSSRKSLDRIQLFGIERFDKNLITPTRDPIRSFLLLDYQQGELSDSCMNSTARLCENQLCLQVNSAATNCFSIDGSFVSTLATINIIGSLSDSIAQQMKADGNTDAVGNSRGTSRSGPWRIVFFCFITIGVFGMMFALFGKRFYYCLNRKGTQTGQNPNAQLYLSTDEPILDEFAVMTDDRTGDRLPLTNQMHH